jgi:hypothetical protein
MSGVDLQRMRNPDQRATLGALRRAGKLAREMAIRMNTGIVVVRDGKRVLISAAELREAGE